MRWVGEEEYDRVAEARMRCYSSAAKHLPRFREGMRADPRQAPGDFLLAERDGQAVGTTTSLSFTMWVRGAPQPCQGVAFVGTLRTHRRAGAPAGTPEPGTREPGVASRLMAQSLLRAREREQVLSALMPFRASFYEHFGYGVVERRHKWVVPLAVLPAGAGGGLRYAAEADRPAIAAAHQRSVERGQCDLARSPARWDMIARGEAQEGFEVIDRPDPAGPVQGYLRYEQHAENGKDYLDVTEQFADDRPAFLRQLSFLAGLKDQYHAATVTLPADLPLNWLLRETQLPHRPVNHPTAELRPYTRMQVRVLDHRRLIEATRLPAVAEGGVEGQVTVAVHECEGHATRLRLTFGRERGPAGDVGRARAEPTEATPEVECPDRVWAAVALGDLPATQAARLGVLTASRPSALRLLDAFAAGPPPFSQEYF